jgi:50S ribosomal protein uL3
LGYERCRSIAIGGKERITDMSLGLVGRKIGMTRVFTDDGAAAPVTVLDVANNRVTQIKTPETDGYAAVQVTYGKRRARRVNKAQAGHLAKAGVEAGELLKEFPVAAEDLATLKVGETVSVETFAVGQLVDVTGTTKGRGFTGVIARHHFTRTAPRTATRSRTTSRARFPWRRTRAGCSRASAWPASTAMCSGPCRR